MKYFQRYSDFSYDDEDKTLPIFAHTCFCLRAFRGLFTPEDLTEQRMRQIWAALRMRGMTCSRDTYPYSNENLSFVPVLELIGRVFFERGNFINCVKYKLVSSVGLLQHSNIESA